MSTTIQIKLMSIYRKKIPFRQWNKKGLGLVKGAITFVAYSIEPPMTVENSPRMSIFHESSTS